MRVGLVGRGRWGKVYLRTFAQMGIEPAFVLGKEDAWRSDADAMVIATPAEFHVTQSLAALSMGVPVLVEKPAALSLYGAERLLEEAVRREVSVFVGHTHLFSNNWREFKESTKGAEQYYIKFGGPFRCAKWWCKGSHAVAMAIDLLGRVRKVRFDFTSEQLILEHARGESFITIQNKPCAVQVECCPNQTGVARYDITYTRPTPMEVLLKEFFASVAADDANVKHLMIACDVAWVLEQCV